MYLEVIGVSTSRLQHREQNEEKQTTEEPDGVRRLKKGSSQDGRSRLI